MPNLTFRPRRLRSSAPLRSLVRETSLSPTDLIYPLFVTAGKNIKNEIPTMPNNYHWSVDKLSEILDKIIALKIPAVILFGIPSYKDPLGSSAWDDNEPVQNALRFIKKNYPHLLVITDVCLCEYTEHGHCGVLLKDQIDNDQSLPLLAKIAISHAKNGADIIAPSNMMDGYVSAIRKALDEKGFTNIPILAYSAKFASSFYGPFRNAVDSTPSFGNRKTYQMDPANSKEALREIELDIREGADIIMVKPALAFLDVVQRASQLFTVPLCVYNVSGEYAMVKVASQANLINEKNVVLEIMHSFKRAGAKMIITYHALDVATWLQEKEEEENGV